MAIRKYDLGKFEREYNSPSNDVLDSLIAIETKAEEKAKLMKLSVDEIYEKLDFDPISHQLDNNKCDAWTEEVEYDILEGLDNFVVPKYTRTMTTFGAAMAVLLNDSKSILGTGAVTDEGVPINKGAYPVKKIYDIIDYISGGIQKHKTALTEVTLALLGTYVGMTAYVNASKTEHGDATDAGIKNAKTEMGLGLGGGALTGLDTINATANGSAEEEYHFSPGIEVHGSDTYKEKVQKALDELKAVDIDEYNEVMKYLEVVREKGDSTVGKGVYTIPEEALDVLGPYALIHEKEHVKQNLEPIFSLYYKGKGGWPKELDAVKKEVRAYAKHHNLTEEQELQRFKRDIAPYKQTYPKEYAQLISGN